MNTNNIIDHEPSIDWNLSVKLANNNKELAKDLLEMFLTDLPNASTKIQTAYNSKQEEELLSQVHRLHGASCYCGVTRLKELLNQLEFSLKERSNDHIEDLMAHFNEEVNNVIAAYKMITY
jgi:two-component system sensor histidine kinase BarA